VSGVSRVQDTTQFSGPGTHLQASGAKILSVVRAHNALYVADAAGGPCPPDVLDAIRPRLTYAYRKRLYGADQYRLSDDGHTSRKQKLDIQPRRLFGLDAGGRVYTSFGLYREIGTAAREAGYAIDYRVAPTGRARPDCYEPNWDAVRRHFQFRPRQEDCLRAIERAPCGLVHAVTGFGKMAMIAMHCVLYPKAKIHVVTRRAVLVHKLVEYLTNYVPLVGQFGAGSKWFGERVTVFTAKSAGYTDYDADFLLGDECHELAANEVAGVLARYQTTRNFGYSATPRGRGDGADARVTSLFGPPVFQIPYPEAVALGLVVPIRVVWHDVHLPSNPALDLEDVERQRAGVWFNDGRNDVIAAAVTGLPDDEQKLALVDTVFHGVELYKRLKHKGFTLVYDQMDLHRYAGYSRLGVLGDEAPRMTPALKEEYRRRLEAGVGNYIATGTWAVGVDPTHLQHVVMAAPWTNEILVQQGPGRVSRTNKTGQKECGIVHDFRDQFDPSFRQGGQVRRRIYDSLGWEQVLATPELLLTTG
jgi:superfamily II DNA or RNA helicase